MITSTVAGAVTALQSHLAAVATANASLNQTDGVIAVYVGLPAAEASDYFLMIGDPFNNGELLVNYESDWAGLPAVAQRRTETYELRCALRCYAGTTDVPARLNEAMTLYSAVMGALAADIGGSNSLSPSGSWQVKHFENPATGQLGGQGWGVVLTFGVEVVNVRLQP